ncbi:MAG: DUF420 domain-containing protein [Planctomycetes bacterium]|nr:DUF420 domain-containing protein [Planctomycetota bacterium]
MMRCFEKLLFLFVLAAMSPQSARAQGIEYSGLDSLRLADLGVIPDFELTESSGMSVKSSDIRGSVWLADFIFTRCAGPCPILSRQMARLQKELPRAVRFVTFSVDPEWDTPQVLAEYARGYGAEPGRWLFLTGRKAEIYHLVTGSFHLTVEDTGGDPGSAILHDTRFMLVDAAGHIRGYYDGNDAEAQARLRADTYALLGRKPPFLPLTVFPPLNACLNAASAVLLIAGFAFIRWKRVMPHRCCMTAAFGVSITFLISYLYYHSHHGATQFQGTGWIRPVYFTILVSHTVLAATVPVLALVTLYRATRKEFGRHARIARWTLPIWLYVSVTGVVIYWMLYCR